MIWLINKKERSWKLNKGEREKKGTINRDKTKQQKQKTKNRYVQITCGFGLYVDVVVGFLTKSPTDECMVDGSVWIIGFFVGFGRNGSLSHCVGRGFVIKFGCVVTCHCVVCAFGDHNPLREANKNIDSFENK